MCEANRRDAPRVPSHPTRSLHRRKDQSRSSPPATRESAERSNALARRCDEIAPDADRVARPTDDIEALLPFSSTTSSWSAVAHRGTRWLRRCHTRPSRRSLSLRVYARGRASRRTRADPRQPFVFHQPDTIEWPAAIDWTAIAGCVLLPAFNPQWDQAPLGSAPLGSDRALVQRHSQLACGHPASGMVSLAPSSPRMPVEHHVPRAGDARAETGDGPDGVPR